jgi:hypothetical protein
MRILVVDGDPEPKCSLLDVADAEIVIVRRPDGHYSVYKDRYGDTELVRP